MELWDPDTNSTRPMTEEEREEYTWIMEAAFDACRTEEKEAQPVDLSAASIEDMVAIGHAPPHLSEKERRYWYWLAVELSKLKRK